MVVSHTGKRWRNAERCPQIMAAPPVGVNGPLGNPQYLLPILVRFKGLSVAQELRSNSWARARYLADALKSLIQGS